MADSIQALTQIIKILKPLSSEDWHRNIDATMMSGTITKGTAGWRT